MMIGHVDIDEKNGAVNTHRDSYLLESISVVSVRRPFFVGGIVFGAGLSGFAAAFGDILYPGEVLAVLTLAAAAGIAGLHVGQLKLLSRDLRGSELSHVIWGRYATLNAVRQRIARAMSAKRTEGRS